MIKNNKTPIWLVIQYGQEPINAIAYKTQKFFTHYKMLTTDQGFLSFLSACWGDNPCLICESACSHYLCSDCLGSIPYIPTAHCPLCSLPSIGVCHACLYSPPPWNHLSAVGWYQDSLKELILGLKYQHKLASASLLAALSVHTLYPLRPPELIVPIPLLNNRLQERGFNQSVEISKEIICKLNLSRNILHANMLIRSGTKPQTKLNAYQRQKNIQNKITASYRCDQKCVWLVDDVYTTGATLRTACQALISAGESSVYAIVIAITKPPAYLNEAPLATEALSYS